MVLALAALAAPATAAASTAVNPFLGAQLFVDPFSDAANQARAWSASRPQDAQLMVKIAEHPWAEWYGDWLADPGAFFRNRLLTWYVPTATTAFIAVYDLPRRDCSGHYSAGGAHSPAAYRAWIRGMAAAIGAYPTIVVVEPDGVPDSPCLGRLQGQRLSLIAYATKTLASLPNTTVYIDAGRSDWVPAARTVAMLRRAGIAYARGFSLDVTGYARTRDELRYGDRIGRALGGKHFIVNTSRNGNGPIRHARTWEEWWCNTPGRALGAPPTTQTGDPLADAFEWVLHPGYSDGQCFGGAKAGTWWPSYALALARRAHW